MKVTALPATDKGTLQLDGTAIASGDLPQTVTKADIDADKLIYTPPSNANGTPYTTFKFKVSDGTADSAEATMTVNVAAVNDAPAVSGTPAVTTNEDTAHTFSAGDFSFSDIDTGDALAGVKVTALPATDKGTLQLDGAAIASGDLPQTVTRADIDADKLTYTPPSNANGTPYTTFKFKVSDGTDDSAEATMTVNVAAVSDAPAVSGTPAVTTDEDTAHTSPAEKLKSPAEKVWAVSSSVPYFFDRRLQFLRRRHRRCAGRREGHCASGHRQGHAAARWHCDCLGRSATDGDQGRY